MDIPVKKKHPLVRYKYRVIAGALLLSLVVYLIVASAGPRRLRYALDRLVIARARQEKFMEYIEVEGIVHPRVTIKLSAVEGGSVDRIVAADGSLLQAGDTILVLRNPELARAIEDERDELAKQQINYREQQIQMERKSSELKRQSLEMLYKMERLGKQHALDREEYRIGIQSKARFEVAADEYAFNQENTRFLLEELKHDSILNTLQVELMQANLARETKRFERVRERLDHLVVRAPVAGQLSFVNVIPGERLVAGAHVGELKIIDQVKVAAKISEYYIDRVAVGQPAVVMYQDERYPLEIIRVNPEIKERQFDVDLLFTAAQPENTRVGKNYRVQVELGQPEDALVIERGPFLQSTGGRWIFKLDESGTRAVKTSLTIGRQNPRLYEVLDGPRPGDRVIVSSYDPFGDAEEIIFE